MSDTITTYRVKATVGKDEGGLHPEVVVSATSEERAKRKAWAASTWPEAVREASNLDAVPVNSISTPISDRSRPER